MKNLIPRFLLSACVVTCSLLQAESTRPNILYIMSDDHGAQAIGAYGGRLAELNPTPTLDRLAAEGVVMENTFCNNAICSPSRATILTGQYSHMTGVTSLGGRVLESDQTLPLQMRQAGYETAVVGKWHLGEQPLAFDYYKVLKSQGKYHNPEFFERVTRDAKETSMTEKGYCSDLIVDASLKWLEGRDQAKPFMLMTQFKAPHGPWDHHERYDSLYADIDIPEPESLYNDPDHGSIATRGHNDELRFRIGSSVGRRNQMRSYLKHVDKSLKATFGELSDDEVKHLSYQDYAKKYLRCVRGVDDNIKRLLDYLEAEGELDNTIVIYTSDQGMFIGEHDYIDKRWMYEEAMRMPFIVRYPKAIAAGSRYDALVNNTDFAPTLLDYAGTEAPASIQGRSFRSIMETGQEPSDWRTATYYRYWLHLAHHHNPAHLGIRTKEWKLIFFYGAPEKEGKNVRTPPGWELYNIKDDPQERVNLYENPEYAAVVAELKQQLKDVRAEVQDTDQDIPRLQEIIERHWDGDLEESIRISNAAGAAPAAGKKPKKK